MFLLDTNVVSELRKLGNGKADPAVIAWAEATDPGITFLSVVTVMQLELGYLCVARRDGAQAAPLRAWLDTRVMAEFRERILPIGPEIALRCAALRVPDPASERDAWIAATALVHRLTVVTRNVKDFQNLGVGMINPFASSS